jgi:CBS-domain-containing membrane protein
MTREVITVNKETSLQEAAGLLAKFRIHGFPVVEDDNKVIGIVTESDFFTKDSSNIFLPTFLRFIRSENMKNLREVGSKEIEKKTKVEDIMTKDCFTVQPETTVEELIQYCKEKNFNSFPVTNKQGMLVGIVTIMDVIKLL